MFEDESSASPLGQLNLELIDEPSSSDCERSTPFGEALPESVHTSPDDCTTRMLTLSKPLPQSATYASPPTGEIAIAVGPEKVAYEDGPSRPKGKGVGQPFRPDNVDTSPVLGFMERMS